MPTISYITNLRFFPFQLRNLQRFHQTIIFTHFFNMMNIVICFSQFFSGQSHKRLKLFSIHHISSCIEIINFSVTILRIQICLVNRLILSLQIMTISCNNIRKMISICNINQRSINITLVTVCRRLKFQIEITRSKNPFHLFAPSDNFFIQLLTTRISMSQKLSGKRATKTSGSTNDMASIFTDDINQVLVISRNSTHTSSHITTTPCSGRNLSNLLMTNCVLCQKNKVIILIIFSIEVTCIQTITTQINLITENHLKVGMVFLYFFINLFDLNCITYSFMVCYGHNLMT